MHKRAAMGTSAGRFLLGGSLLGGSLLGSAALAAYAVRGRSSQFFAPSIYRGPRDHRAVAVTFDDGPSESTPQLLEVLDRYHARATFFQCGANVRRLPDIARRVLEAGHEIGNHSDTHAPLYLSSATQILAEFERAQRTIKSVTGVCPKYLRAPFGARWFGFGAMQRRLRMTGVMWSIIGRDWTADAAAVTRRVLRGVVPGSIVCLHDGRELRTQPDISATIDALERILPELSRRGYRFLTISDLLCPTS